MVNAMDKCDKCKRCKHRDTVYPFDYPCTVCEPPDYVMHVARQKLKGARIKGACIKDDAVSRASVFALISKLALESGFSEDQIERMRKGVEALQPVGVVSVVRCHECIHRHRGLFGANHVCDRSAVAFTVEDDGFCKWGERKEAPHG